MKFRLKNADGTVSIDRKIKRLEAYVNREATRQACFLSEEDCVAWARNTLEQGALNIVRNAFADREEE